MSQFSKGNVRGPAGAAGNKPAIGASRPAGSNAMTSKVPAAPPAPAKGGTGMAARAGAKFGPAPTPPRGNNPPKAPPLPPRPAAGKSPASAAVPPAPPAPRTKVPAGSTGMAARAGAKLGPAPGRPNAGTPPAAPAGGNNFVKGVKPGGPKQGLTQGVNKSGTDRLPLGYGGNARGKAIVGAGNKIGKTIPAGPNAKIQSKQP